MQHLLAVLLHGSTAHMLGVITAALVLTRGMAAWFAPAEFDRWVALRAPANKVHRKAVSELEPLQAGHAEHLDELDVGRGRTRVRACVLNSVHSMLQLRRGEEAPPAVFDGCYANLSVAATHDAVHAFNGRRVTVHERIAVTLPDAASAHMGPSLRQCRARARAIPGAGQLGASSKVLMMRCPKGETRAV